MEDWTNHEYHIGYMIGSITYYLNLFKIRWVCLKDFLYTLIQGQRVSSLRQLGTLVSLRQRGDPGSGYERVRGCGAMAAGTFGNQE
jgi:hypothetical protein